MMTEKNTMSTNAQGVNDSWLPIGDLGWVRREDVILCLTHGQSGEEYALCTAHGVKKISNHEIRRHLIVPDGAIVAETIEVLCVEAMAKAVWLFTQGYGWVMVEDAIRCLNPAFVGNVFAHDTPNSDCRRPRPVSAASIRAFLPRGPHAAGQIYAQSGRIPGTSLNSIRNLRTSRPQAPSARRSLECEE